MKYPELISNEMKRLMIHDLGLLYKTKEPGIIAVLRFKQVYGKDSVVISQKAVEHTGKNSFHVVLDTAGRRHNKDRLISNLEKLGSQTSPDKIIMDSETLVGTDIVDLARKFDTAFGKNRRPDLFPISKCDVIGELLGTIVNIIYATVVPVLFVGMR